MTSPLETKARALAGIEIKAVEVFKSLVLSQCYHSHYTKDCPFCAPATIARHLRAFASEVERDALERAANVADSFRNRPDTPTIGAIVLAIRSLSEPPAETPEPKG